MNENEKPRDPVERIRRGLTGNFGKGDVVLKLRYEEQERGGEQVGVFNWLPGALAGALVGWNFDRIIRWVKGIEKRKKDGREESSSS